MMKSMGALAVALALSGTALAQQVSFGSDSPLETVERLAPGQFVWAPEVAPEGPMLVVVNRQSHGFSRTVPPLGMSAISNRTVSEAAS
jgi:hypothetical protein